jgi:hypothetical protein
MSTSTAEGPEPIESKKLNGAAPAAADQENNDVAAKVAIAGVIGVGAAPIEASLIPGILIGAAAILAPKYLPGIRERVRPLVKSTIRGAYRLTEKTREAFAEAQEQVQDIMAEARHEDREAEAVATSASITPPAHQG